MGGEKRREEERRRDKRLGRVLETGA